ncbi:PilC/PilY family type IV pilus protein [Desulfuromonas acetoxidans]|uniref:pilus assembly protein n=1 Tax=Desulfuromonas acetoxidans TaxID=891 RepID=UPI00292FDFD5|nr:PilC/PilY family type IV pilus protein [Desulfuromonas acetoxidans]
MRIKTIVWLIVLLFASTQTGWAEPDYYGGDSTVYVGSSIGARPNIMFLIDNSGAMKDMGSQEPFDPEIDYATLLDDDAIEYPAEQVYLRNVSNENITNYQTTKFTVSEVDCSRIVDETGTYDPDDFVGDYQTENPDGDGYDDATGEIHPRYALEQNGFWYGALDSKGSCPNNENQWENYFTGNFRNYLQASQNVTTWSEWKTEAEASDPADYQLGALVKPSDYGLYFKCIEINGAPGATEPNWNPDGLADGPIPGTVVYDGDVVWEALGTVMDMVQYQMEHVVFDQVRDRVNMGMMTFGENNHGGRIIEPVQEAGINDTNGPANYSDLIAGLQTLEDLVNGNTQPVNESLWDAYLYWIGDSDSSAGIASDKVYYPSPIEYWCQSNHLVILTTGSAGNNSQTQTKVGDVDEDGNPGLVDDVAKLMYDNLGINIDGYDAQVQTHVIQLMTPYVQRLEYATDDSHGHGKYYNIKNPQELIDALLEIIGGILEENSSFVAPVVPASPDNRAYSGQHIYLGFFKPMNEEPWMGNLKKFGLSSESRITGFDSSDNIINATYSYPTDTNDEMKDGYFVADADGLPTVRSYWGTTMDGGEVNLGGAGEQLLDMEISPAETDRRKIYTVVGNSLVEFTRDNVTTTLLEVADDDQKNAVVDFIRGYDAYGDDPMAKRSWMLGDIMHSKPVVLNYQKTVTVNETITVTDEETGETTEETIPKDSSVVSSVIYVGSNDGMLHAIDDATGQELWAFIPPDLLPNLQYASSTDKHYYYVDSSPVLYHYDYDGDGKVNLDDLASDLDTDATDEKALLVCGMHRGGGTSQITQPADPDTDPPVSRGSYFALDVSDPDNPSYKWTINSETNGFGELSQTWSLPRLTKVKVGNSSVVVAIFGAGYDTSEDLRFGNTQTYPVITADTVTSDADAGAENTTSVGTETEPFDPRGRGLYIIELATLGNSVSLEPSFSSPPELVWSFTHADDTTNMNYSIPSDPLLVDRDGDGFTDHVYVGDSGGQLWRFNLEDNTIDNDTNRPNQWTGTCIFKANITAGDVGRKVFFKPTATVSNDDIFVYFGTGDREHPLNTAVIDRFYMVRDRESESGNDDGGPWPLDESDLVDVTEDTLQDPDASDDVRTLIRTKLSPPYTVEDTTYYGWYIKNDLYDGEKVLALPKVVSNVLYYTTYTPAIIDPDDVNFDPCTGNLGPSRLYAVNAKTAEAVYNFDVTNDTVDDEGNPVLLKRGDRSLAVGNGIASEPLIIVRNDGSLSVMVGRGGGFFNSGTVGSIDPVFPVYWMKW